jgi:hypothetical protein
MVKMKMRSSDPGFKKNPVTAFQEGTTSSLKPAYSTVHLEMDQ